MKNTPTRHQTDQRVSAIGRAAARPLLADLAAIEKRGDALAEGRGQRRWRGAAPAPKRFQALIESHKVVSFSLFGGGQFRLSKTAVILTLYVANMQRARDDADLLQSGVAQAVVRWAVLGFR